MDSAEHKEIQELIKEGRHPSDEGPFYYHSFWQAYKGGVRGKVGGFLIGTLLGVASGLVAAACLLPVAGISSLTIIGGFTAAGMLYGAHEFSEVGRVTGAVAAAQKDAETRMQSFEEAKFTEIKQEINELKDIVQGKSPAEAEKATAAAAADTKAVEEYLENYRTTHFRKDIPAPKGNQYIFWKIAIAGLLLGAGLGALLGFGGAGATLLAPLHLPGIAGAAGAEVAVAGASIAGMSLKTIGLISMVALGAVGASFGINRDLFRKIFDKTDLIFKGVFYYGEEKYKKKAVQQELATGTATTLSTAQPSLVSTLVFPQPDPDSVQSDTFHRDRIVAGARQTLLDMDHSIAQRH